jgi:hypothetical protein
MSVTRFDPLRIIFWEEPHQSFTAEPAYNDIRLYNTSYITSYILQYQSVPHC